ncbi:DUF885 domain-containing protein [Asticcacaulis taihuensis]|uniref:Uncharacterized conserved protein, DUF885 familyt n=1 Tax=Asticcacaulis taihuensis TaxID=260084 RepID=A0A1G4QH27_9CAUL|nr:DUF885 family protein [Asticcacaulis taihuensis]SCW43822.1 Uncharacterized conserved protein, DUF885 familyt [Asticcacaulis taihuensis]
MIRPVSLTLAMLLLNGGLAHAAPTTPVAACASASDQKMITLVADFEALSASRDPIRESGSGNLAALAQWPDDSVSTLKAYGKALNGLMTRLTAIPANSFCPDQALNQALIRDRLQLELDGLRFDEARLPFNTGDGFYTVPDYAAAGVVLRTEPEARAWIAKLKALPAYYATETDNMKRGIATGFMRPKLVAGKALAVMEKHAAQPVAEHSLLNPLKNLPDTIPTEIRAELVAEGMQIIATQVRPAEDALVAFFKTEYVPKAPDSIAIGDLPDGKAYYQYLIHRNASTDMTPEAIHALGLSEMKRIRAEMDADIKASGFKGSFAKFQTFIRTDPQFIAESPEDYYAKVSAVLIRVQGLLPIYFHHLPRQPVTVHEVDPQLKSSSSGYNPASLAQGLPGTVVINTDHLDQSPTSGLTAWTLHEGLPGHHLQIALAQENDALPKFRRRDDINAFVEGWALYSEHLGVEMGMYRNPYEDFGRLSLEMWRACRLVIDTGMHTMGWSRDQAVACLRDNTGLSDRAIQNEVDRYIGWPGQALGYKIGEIRIRQLRAKAEAGLGPKFDLRDFHDEILKNGPLPLDILSQQVDDWIRRGGR